MNNKQKIIYIYFLMLPFVDLATSLITRLTNFSISLGTIVKGLTIIFSVCYILFFSKSKNRKKSIYYLIVLCIFALFYFLFKREMWTISNLITETITAFRYLYYPVMILGVYNIFDDCKIDSKFIKKILVFNCLTYIALILIPYFTNTSFNSYSDAGVYGVSGWFYSANELSILVIILTSSIYYFMDSKKPYKIVVTFPIIYAITRIGTKVSYFGLIISLIIVSLYYIIKNKKVILPIILTIFLLISSSDTPTIVNFQESINRVFINTKKVTNTTNNTSNTTNNVVIDDTPINNDEPIEVDEPPIKIIVKPIELVPNEEPQKIIAVVLNGRSDFFRVNYSVYKNSGIINQLFGLGWSNRPSIRYTIDAKLIEIDYLDIVIHYGILGMIIYFIPFLYFVYKSLIRIKQFNLNVIYYYLYLGLSFSVAFFAGHVLSAPAVSIYIILLMYIISDELKKNVKLKEKEITIMALHLNYGGIEKYISSLCKMLDRDYKINIIVTYKSKPAFEFSDRVNIKYLINAMPNKEEFISALKNKQLFRIIKEGFKAVRLLILKKQKNIKAIMGIRSKYIITTRDFHSKLVGKYANENIIKIATEHNHHNDDEVYIEKLINSIRGFDYFVVVSKDLENYYKNMVGNTKCIYIPNTLDSLPKVSSNLKENNIINVGRLETVKGQKELIDVVKIVKEKIDDLKLFLIGDGSLKGELKEYIHQNNLDDTVVMTGFLKPKEMEKYLKKSKLFVMTSLSESFGLVLIEAMSYKIPCIAFDSAQGAKELLKGDIGILVKKRNVDKMAEEIIKLMKDDKKLLEYSKKSYDKCQEFLLENVQDKWFNLLEKGSIK